MLTALNKVDRLDDPAAAQATLADFPRSFAISALKNGGIQELLLAVQQELYENLTPVTVRLPYQQGQLISTFHELGQVERIEHRRGGVFIQGRVPGRLLAQFSPWQAPPDGTAVEEETGAEEI
jgi:GTP-binding protein HflX